MITGDGCVRCDAYGVLQAPSLRKITKEVKQRQPCYLTLVIYDKTEEPPVSVGHTSPAAIMCRVCVVKPRAAA